MNTERNLNPTAVAVRARAVAVRAVAVRAVAVRAVASIPQPLNVVTRKLAKDPKNAPSVCLVLLRNIDPRAEVVRPRARVVAARAEVARAVAARAVAARAVAVRVLASTPLLLNVVTRKLAKDPKSDPSVCLVLLRNIDPRAEAARAEAARAEAARAVAVRAVAVRAVAVRAVASTPLLLNVVTRKLAKDPKSVPSVCLVLLRNIDPRAVRQARAVAARAVAVRQARVRAVAVRAVAVRVVPKTNAPTGKSNR